MHTLTAFEFIGASDGPQVVRLVRHGETVIQCAFTGWIGIDCRSLGLDLTFDDPTDLSIEGDGLGRPYWDGEIPSWAASFNPVVERRRIEAIRTAARAEIRRLSVSLS